MIATTRHISGLSVICFVLLASCLQSVGTTEIDYNSTSSLTPAAPVAMDDRAATAIVSEMGIGWNLGNSLDAVGGETAWGNPVVTQKLIDAVAATGFGAVRVPVTWINHLGTDYAINSAWLDRVEQVVNYCLNDGLYVIINIHHDGGYNVAGKWINMLDSSGNVTSSNTALVEAHFVTVWRQIAGRFKNYGDHVLFESMNEVGNDTYTDSPSSSCYGFINTLNQSFVASVRASGGNNDLRCLVVPGYNTNIKATQAGFSVPTDTASNRLILSCHFYDPWNYAGGATTHYWGSAYSSLGIDSWGQESYMISTLGGLASFASGKGLPVILGEYGACYQGTTYEPYRTYYMEYVTTVCHLNAIAPFYWDNGSQGSGSDAFGMFNRSTYAVLHQSTLTAMMNALEHTAVSDIATP